jgi:hypothetical protein
LEDEGGFSGMLEVKGASEEELLSRQDKTSSNW